MPNDNDEKQTRSSRNAYRRNPSKENSKRRPKNIEKTSDLSADDSDSAKVRTSSRPRKKDPASEKQSLTSKPLHITANKPDDDFVKPLPRVRKTKTPPQPFDSTLNQSSFGRVRKPKVRKSCVYNTPEETAQEKPVKAQRKRKNKEEDEAYEARPVVPAKKSKKKEEEEASEARAPLPPR